MAKYKTIGKINKNVCKNNCEETIEWSITDFLSLTADKDIKGLLSPTFSFEDCTWYLSLISDFYPEYISLSILIKDSREFSVEYCCGLKKKNGSVEKSASGILQGHITQTVRGHFIKMSEVKQRKSQLLPVGVFTVTCSLKRDGRKLTKFIKLDTLSENYKNLFENKINCDVTLHVRNKEYKAHKLVLVARSKVFAAMFQHEMTEKQTSVITITDCDPDSFEQFLEFLYCGQLEILSFCKALSLYGTSDKYDIQELKTFCTECLIENLNEKNWCKIVNLADTYDDGNLLSAAQCFFTRNSRKIFERPEWERLMKDNFRLGNELLKGMSK